MRVGFGMAAVGVALVMALTQVSAASAQTPASAPPGDDWTLASDDDVTAAVIGYDSGIDIVVRCAGGRFETLIAGLPPATGRTRELRFSDGPGPGQPDTWYVGRYPTVAVTTFPARFARSLREGGSLNMVVPGGAENGRNLRYVLDLPASPSAINATLTACGKPIDDPRDALIEEVAEGGLPEGIAWRRAPEPNYPDRRMYEWGFASVSCLSDPGGVLRQCEVEAEHPLDGGFGQATLNAVRAARVEVRGQRGAPVPRRMIVFTTRFGMSEIDRGTPTRAPTGSRLTRPD